MDNEQGETIVYLAGPMRGYENLNFGTFEKRAEELRDQGYVVMNPTEIAGGYKDMPVEWYLSHDIDLIKQCDALAVLDGWHQSEGAKLEVHVASKLGLDIIRAKDPDTELNVDYNPNFREVRE